MLIMLNHYHSQKHKENKLNDLQKKLPNDVLLYLTGISSIATNTVQKIPTEMKVLGSVETVLTTVIAATRMGVTLVRKAFIFQVSTVQRIAKYAKKNLDFFFRKILWIQTFKFINVFYGRQWRLKGLSSLQNQAFALM